jgi:hypothetical protein
MSRTSAAVLLMILLSQLIAGDFENLSHQIQKKIGMKEYHVRR